MDTTGLDVHYIAIDSRVRDVQRYPNLSDYVVPLKYVLRDVESIELMTLQISRGETNIHSGNRTLRVTVNGGPVRTVALDGMQYPSLSSLTDALSSRLRDADPALTAILDAASQKIAIVHGDGLPFSVEFAGSLDRILGFPPATGFRRSSDTGRLEGAFPMDLSAEPYILLHLNDFDRYIGNTEPIDSAFFMIPFEERPWRSRFHICNSELEKKGIYLLNSTHRNLTEMRVRFVRPDGSLYDFGGMDHQIVLRVTSRNKRSN